MAEDRPRRVSLLSSLYTVGRKAFRGRHNSQSQNESVINGLTLRGRHIGRKEGMLNGIKPVDGLVTRSESRIVSLGPTVNPSQNSRRQPSNNNGLASSRGREAGQPNRHVSLPVHVLRHSTHGSRDRQFEEMFRTRLRFLISLVSSSDGDPYNDEFIRNEIQELYQMRPRYMASLQHASPSYRGPSGDQWTHPMFRHTTMESNHGFRNNQVGESPQMSASLIPSLQNAPPSNRDPSGDQSIHTISRSMTTEPNHGARNNQSDELFQLRPRSMSGLQNAPLSSRDPSNDLSTHPMLSSTTTSRPANSRIPTPINAPDGEIYSHAVYQREGRRSVLSSLSKRYTALKQNIVNRNNSNNDLGEREARESHLIQPSGRYQGSKQIPNQYGWISAPIQGPSRAPQGLVNDHPRLPVPMNDTSRAHRGRVHTMIPLPVSNPAARANFINPLRQHPPHQPLGVTSSLVPQVQPSTEQSPFEENIPKNDEFRTFNRLPGHAKRLPLRKARVSSDVLPRQGPSLCDELTKDDETTANKAANPTSSNPRGEMSTKKQRRVNNSENIKNIQMPKPFTYGNSTRPGTLGLEPPRSIMSRQPESGRHRDQTERMVPRATSSVASPSSFPFPKPELTRGTGDTNQVSEAQPEQYWLGRFMTLINAFHYEDSFNEPDIATGFGMLSSYSRPLAQANTDLASYRVKRAFMVLENLCLTEEASDSLRKFRDGYIAIHGDRWMK